MRIINAFRTEGVKEAIQQTKQWSLENEHRNACTVKNIPQKMELAIKKTRIAEVHRIPEGPHRAFMKERKHLIFHLQHPLFHPGNIKTFTAVVFWKEVCR